MNKYKGEHFAETLQDTYGRHHQNAKCGNCFDVPKSSKVVVGPQSYANILQTKHFMVCQTLIGCMQIVLIRRCLFLY